MRRRPVPVTAAWAWALLGAATVVALAAAPPVLGGEAGWTVHRAFALFCHQIPERSFRLHGMPFGLCHRCFGVASGLALGVALAPLVPAALADRAERLGTLPLLAAALAPTALDWLVGALGLWANTPASRSLTGALFGLVAGWTLAVALAPRPVRPRPDSPHPTLLST